MVSTFQTKLTRLVYLASHPNIICAVVVLGKVGFRINLNVCDTGKLLMSSSYYAAHHIDLVSVFSLLRRLAESYIVSLLIRLVFMFSGYVYF